MKLSILVLSIITVLSLGCSSVRVVESGKEGGTVKFRKRGLAKDERKDQALGEADKHCKINGFKTYGVESEYEDGRFRVIRFACKN